MGLGVCSDGEQRAVVTVTAVLRERYETPEGFFRPRYHLGSMRATRRTRCGVCLSLRGPWGPLAPVCPASLTCSRNHATATRCVATVSGQQTLRDDKPTRSLHTGQRRMRREGGGRRQPRRRGRRLRRSARRACRARVICLGRRRVGANGPAAAAGPAPAAAACLPRIGRANQVFRNPDMHSSRRHLSTETSFRHTDDGTAGLRIPMGA